ncbi:AI-2E family transporter [Novosphingobium endophyticum]|nr:AI-2E family transporter [Novosphingobium endophyticum]
MKRLIPDDADKRFIRRVVILIAILLVVMALYRAIHIFILAFGSILGAIIIRSLSSAYESRLHLPHRWAVLAGMLTALAFIVALVWLFTVQFGQQINLFVTSLPEIVGQLEAMLSTSPVGAKIVDAVEAAYAGSRVATDIGGIVAGSAELVLNILLVIVGSFFLAADPTAYERGFLLLVPEPQREAFADALEETAEKLRAWLIAQMIQMTTMGVMVGVGLWLAGVPSAAALGLLAGLSEFIPYIGPTVAMVPALGLAATRGTDVLIGALVTFAVVRLIQTNLITPYVQQRVIRIPPAITLFAILAIGAITGLYGLFFAAAFLVVIFTLVRSLYVSEVLGERLRDEDSAPGSHGERNP